MNSQIVAGNVPMGYQLVADSMVVIWPGCNGPAYKMYLNLDCDTDMDIKMQAVSYCDPPNSNWRLYWEVYILDSSFQIAETHMVMTLPELVCTHVNSGVLIEQGSNPTNPGGLVWNPRVGLYVNANGPSFYNPYPFPSLSYDGYIPIRKKINGEYLYGWIHLSTSNPINYYTDKIYSHTKLPLYSVIRDTISCHDSYTFIDGLTLNNLIRDTTRDLLLTSTSGCDSLVRTILKVPSAYIGHNYDTSSSGQPVVFIDGSSFTYPLAGSFTHNNHFISVNGCDSLIVTHIYIYEALNYSSSHNVFTRCHGTTVGLNPHHSGGKPPISYLWAPISGVGATFNTESIQFIADTSITYVLTAIDSLGSIAKDTLQIIVDTPLVMHPITSQYPTFCKDSMLLFSNSLGNIHWQKYNSTINVWENTTLSAASENLLIHTYGTYRYINSNTCGNVTKSISIHPNLLYPAAYSTKDTICPGRSITLSGGGGVSYSWNGGVLNNVPFIPTTTQTYTVLVTDVNGCTNTAAKLVVVDTMAHLDSISVSSAEICQDQAVSLSLKYHSSYCTPYVVSPTVGYLNSIQIDYQTIVGNAFYYTSNNEGYGYKNHATSMLYWTAGTYCYSIINSNYSTYPYPSRMNKAIWIDCNQDGDFADDGELVFYDSTSNTNQATGVWMIPAKAYNGITKMRIASGVSNLNYCSSTYGSFEDFNIFILEGQDLISWTPIDSLNYIIGTTVSSIGLQDTTVFKAFIVNDRGCLDSISKTIIVKSNSKDTTHIDICPNQLPYNWLGQNYSLSGNYTMNYTNSLNCDSLYTLQLTIHETNTSVTNNSICSNQLPYLWNGQSYSLNGVYTTSFLNSFGCDSIAMLDLSINPTTSSSSNATICSSQLPYLWNGQSYSLSGVYTTSYLNSFGCDSIEILNLSIHPTNLSSSDATICSNQLPYLWNGQSYSLSGVYTSSYLNSFGCDSIETLNLIIQPTTIGSSNVTICSNQLPFLWNGQNINLSGVYTSTYLNSFGCDSIAMLDLTINPTTSNLFNATVCSNHLPYVWNGQSVYISGMYTSSYINTFGCDSVATLYLTVEDTTVEQSSLTICSHQLPFHWNEENIISAGVYQSNFINNFGCDSIQILNLIVLEDMIEISQTGNLLIATQGPYNYQWFDANNHSIIQGATNSSYIAKHTGMYSVIISNGMCVDTSSMIQVQSLSFNNNSNECNFQAYPNPVSKNLIVSYGDNESTAATLEIYDEVGRLILKQLLVARQLTSIDIENLPYGVYFVRCDACVKKIVKE